MGRPVTNQILLRPVALYNLPDRIIGGFEVLCDLVQFADPDLIILIYADEILRSQEVEVGEALLQLEDVELLVLGEREYPDRSVDAPGEEQSGLLVDALQRQNLAFLAIEFVQELLAVPVFPHLEMALSRCRDKAAKLVHEQHIGNAVLRLYEPPIMVNQRAVQLVEGQSLLGPMDNILPVFHELLALDPRRRLLKTRNHPELAIE